MVSRAIKPGIFCGAGVNRSMDETRTAYMWYGGRRFEFEPRRRRQVGGAHWSQNDQLPSEISVSWLLAAARGPRQSTAALSSVGIPQPQTTEPPVCSAI